MYFLTTEEYEDGKPSSTLLVYFSAIMGISTDGSTFARPRRYTPKLSALIYCIRLIVLESTLPRFAHSFIGWEARPRYGQIDLLNRVRAQKMCLGSQAPMGELISLRSYGRSLSRSDGPSFRVLWSEDGQQVSWGESHQLSIADFKQISQDVLQSAAVICDRLMYNWRPNFDLKRVRDKLSNSTQAYSFVSDPANRLSDAYLDLSRRACLAAVDGLMTDNSWDMDAVQRYLALHDEMLQLLMLLIHLTAGQAARGTEMLSVEYRNGPSTLRGICVYTGKIIVITRHHKCRRVTNNEFQVARFLPCQVARFFYQYLVYIRPFSCMIRRVCLGINVDPSLLFFSVTAPKEPWKTQVLSKALRRFTNSRLGYGIGVRLYRQLSIAITDKHIQHISKPFDRHQDKGHIASVSAVFAWQSGHRPWERGTTYGLDGAFPDSLQPTLLRLYEWASGEWQKFLGMGRPEATPGFEAAAATTMLQIQSESSYKQAKRPASPQLLTSPPPSKRTCVSRPVLGDISPNIMSTRLGRANQILALEYEKRGSTNTGLDRIESESTGEYSEYALPPSRIPLPFNYSSSIPAISELVLYNEKYKALVCIVCGICIKPSPADKRHLMDLHGEWPLELRKDILTYASRLCIAQPEEVVDPEPTEDPLPGLSIHDGWACKNCGYLCTSLGTMKEHCKRTHQWRKANVNQWRAAKVQTFFGGNKRRFFEVAACLTC